MTTTAAAPPLPTTFDEPLSISLGAWQIYQRVVILLTIVACLGAAIVVVTGDLDVTSAALLSFGIYMSGGFIAWLFCRRERLQVSMGRVSVKTWHTSTDVAVSDITRLRTFRYGLLYAAFSMERRDGGAIRFYVLGRVSAPMLQRVLQRIERITGHRWEGRQKRASFRAFIAAMKRAANVRSMLDLLRWAARHAILVRFDEADVDHPLLAWAHQLIVPPLLLASLMALLAIVIEPLPVWFYVVLLAIIGPAVTLGINIAVVLMREQVRGREALETELAAAQEVQRQLLPASAPRLAGFDVDGSCTPAEEVGGDYYDFVPLPSGNLVVPVADVSGKGLSAALLMTLVKGALRTGLGANEELLAAASLVNQTVYDSAEAHTFVSMALAKLDPIARTATLVRAGHNPPLVVTNAGATQWLNAPGLALGLAGGRRFDKSCTAVTVPLHPGDVLVLYSDGVTEAMNDRSEEFGEERLADVVTRQHGGSAAEIQAAVVEEVNHFRAGTPPNDDMTLVIVKAV